MAQQLWVTPDMQELFRAVLKLKNVQECARFFRDLMTIEEIREMANRWKAARLLDDGLTYRDVAFKTGMSTTTVARIAFWLRDGEGGYRLVLDRMKNQAERRTTVRSRRVSNQQNAHHTHPKRSLMNRGEQRM